MKRDELLKSDEYWILKIQMGLFAAMEDYMLEKGLNKTQLAQELGVTKGYVSQVLSGNFDHRISKMVNLALKVGRVPEIDFKSINKVIYDDSLKYKGKENNYHTLLRSHLDVHDYGFQYGDTQTYEKVLYHLQ
ncbi:helix-turn-helix transcriptional regulator [Spirosoma sp. KCTC 42546]|uniref:helix-turn-helix domain-containing protein n=1 Tax=Spirosoma sp. KCTC 42546 TaxID=2520506 RepID=UPI001159E145|nr:helix-turn-helix transcriptional regulator [Spirosoma sp. KCTC 42546]QDK81230.1 helix-turn-helix transcriptional regulator [Spirosoma sp. KCTC 42546]